MPHLYLAPRNCTGVFIPSGEARADAAGRILLSDSAPLEDHRALLTAGCILAPLDPVVGELPAAGAAQAKFEPIKLRIEPELDDEA